eukprot:gene6946-biopygen2060
MYERKSARQWWRTRSRRQSGRGHSLRQAIILPRPRHVPATQTGPAPPPRTPLPSAAVEVVPTCRWSRVPLVARAVGRACHWSRVPLVLSCRNEFLEQ